MGYGRKDPQTIRIEATTDAGLKQKVDGLESQLAHNAKQQQLTPSIQPYDSKIEYYREVLIHDGNDAIYASYLMNGVGYYLEKTTDNGETWTRLSGLPATIECAIKVSKTGTIIIIERAERLSVGSPRVWRSTDDGISWELVNAGLNFAPLSPQGIVETPSGAICIGEYGNIGNHSYRILRSTDDGATWSTVLSSPGTDPQGDPGHIHSVTYDPYAKKLIAFMDRPANTTYGARIYESSDDGATWSILGVVDTNAKPNFVAPMYFETHIAWGTDNDRNGMISRISREDFYSGNFSKAEDVAHLNNKVFYYTFPLREDVWLISMANETINASNVPEGPGNYANEIYIVSNNGSVISGGITFYEQQWTPGVLRGRRITFPAYKFDRLDHKGLSWMNLNVGYPNQYAAMPYSQGLEYPKVTVGNWLTQKPTLPNMYPLSGKDGDGRTDIGMLKTNRFGQVVLYNGLAAEGNEIRLNKDNSIEFYQNNKRVARMQNGMFIPDELSLSLNGVVVKSGSSEPNNNVSGHPGSLYIYWNGGAGKYLWEKRSGTGNTGWQPIGSLVKGSIVGAPSKPYLGMMYMYNDGSVGSKTKPVWWDGSDWVDANGDTV